MVVQTIGQLYFASLQYYSKKFDEITVYLIKYIINSFKFNSQEDMDYLTYDTILP